MALKQVIVVDILRETTNIISIYLSMPDGTSIGQYRPGARARTDAERPTAIAR